MMQKKAYFLAYEPFETQFDTENDFSMEDESELSEAEEYIHKQPLKTPPSPILLNPITRDSTTSLSSFVTSLKPMNNFVQVNSAIFGEECIICYDGQEIRFGSLSTGRKKLVNSKEFRNQGKHDHN